MTVWRCNECGGEYQDPQRDGTRYFHVCPPVHNPDYQPDPAKAGYDPREFVERPDRRDENVELDVGPDPERRRRTLETRPRADGAGRTEVVRARG